MTDAATTSRTEMPRHAVTERPEFDGRDRRRRPRLIVSDLDGTFLSPDGTVSDRNLAAAEAAERAGIPVVFATGRPIRLLDPIRPLNRTHAMVIASNGAMTYDLGSESVLAARVISHPMAAEACADLRSAIPDVAFAVDTGARAGYEPLYADYHGGSFGVDDDPNRVIAELPELLTAGDFVKLLVLRPGTAVDELTDQVRQVLAGRLSATHSSPTRALVEVAAAGVSKASTLASVCERLGVPAADVAAFGDMPNDLEMLRWVGMPYVMEHAHPELREIGATVIGSNADSAVGATIESWL
jgi:Cof subfamily protein (haloacid dehalogenase superfamily)